MEEPSPQPGAWPRPRGPAPRPHRDLNAGGSFPKAPRLLPTSAQLRLVLQPHTAGQGPCQAPGPTPPRPHRPDASSETRTQGPGRAQKPPLPLPLSHHGAGRQTLTDTRSYGSPRAGRQGRAGCTRGARCLGPAPRGSSPVTRQVSLLAASECSEVRIVYLTFTCPFFFFFLLLLLYPFQFSEGKSSHVLWVSETPPHPARPAAYSRRSVGATLDACVMSVPRFSEQRRPQLPRSQRCGLGRLTWARGPGSRGSLGSRGKDTRNGVLQVGVYRPGRSPSSTSPHVSPACTSGRRWSTGGWWPCRSPRCRTGPGGSTRHNRCGSGACGQVKASHRADDTKRGGRAGLCLSKGHSSGPRP